MMVLDANFRFAHTSQKDITKTQNKLLKHQRHRPIFLNMSKTQNKVLKHLKDTEQTSQTPQTV